MGMPGMGMPGYGGMGGDKLVKYKLIRFNDFTVEPGHKYRYKVRAVVEDPNYPGAAYTAPSLAGLDDEARTRVRDVEAKDLARKAERPTSYRLSEWSAPSDVSTMPPTEWFYAGKAEPEPASPIPGTKLRYRTGEPSATALAVVQDPKKAVDVPVKHTVMRGSALNFTEDVEVIHPVFGDKRKLEKYLYQTNAVVADMRGGEEIPLVVGTHDQPFKAPGEILFVDAAGNMHVQDEAQDIDNFHRFLGPQEEEKAKKKKEEEPGAMAPPGFEGMLPGMTPGIPGGVPGGGKTKR
jgi:hypothetical protein